MTAVAKKLATLLRWLLPTLLSGIEDRVSAVMAIVEGDRDDGIAVGRSDEILGLLDEVKGCCALIEREQDKLMTDFIRMKELSNEEQPWSLSDPNPESGNPELENFEFNLRGNKPTDEKEPSRGRLEWSAGEIVEEEELRGMLEEKAEEGSKKQEEVEKLRGMLKEMVEIVEEGGHRREELERKNEEKREIITRMRMKVEGLMAENEALHDRLVVGSEVASNGGNMEPLRRTRSFKGILFNKIFQKRS